MKMISEESLEKFERTYKKEFGEELSDKDTLEKATKLLRLVEIIYKPMTQEEYEKVQNAGKKQNKEIIERAAERLAEILIAQIEAKKK